MEELLAWIHLAKITPHPGDADSISRPGWGVFIAAMFLPTGSDRN